LNRIALDTHGLILVAWLTACASTHEPVEEPSPAGSSSIPPTPSEQDGGADAGDAAERPAGECPDCEFFPENCSAGSLCPNGLFDSSRPGALDRRLQINVIRGRSVDDVWAAGALGTIVHFDGTTWTPSDLGSGDSLLALWIRESSEVAFSSISRAYTRNLAIPDAGAGPSTSGWSPVVLPAPVERQPDRATLTASWSGPNGNWHWYTSTDLAPGFFHPAGLWRMQQSPSGTFVIEAHPPLTTVCNQCSRMKSIHGLSDDEAWAVGESGSAILISNADGAEPTLKEFDTRTWKSLNGVWVASPAEAWAVGAAGTVRRYTGDPGVWEVVSGIPTDEDLRAIWGSSSRDIWVVGDAGVVLRYDGTSWSRVKIAGLDGRRPNLTTVWGAARDHVWIGGQGVLLSLGGKP